MADHFDVIVVGAGMAGVACAGELVLRGKRPLLVAESKEVGYNFRPVKFGESSSIPVQQPTRQVAWGGGWWWNLARDLNIPISVCRGFDGFGVTVRGTGTVHQVPSCVSPSSLVEAMGKALPIGIAENRQSIEKILQAAVAIPYQQLLTMHDLPMSQWLEDHGADEMVTMIMLLLGANLLEVTLDDAREHMSAFACIGLLRTYIFSEGQLLDILPDPRNGWCIPVAREVERRGGAVLRGKKVQSVLIENDRAVGVAMTDGTELRGDKVAIATGYDRINGLLDPLPSEVFEPLKFAAQFSYREHTMLAMLDRRPPAYPETFLALFEMDGSALCLSWPVDTPGSVEEGRWVIASQSIRSQAQIETLGGSEGVFASMRTFSEELYPGFTESAVQYADLQHPAWTCALLSGPKLPRTIESVKDLWFVGEGSVPVGAVYADGAASCGILGARAMTGTT